MKLTSRQAEIPVLLRIGEVEARTGLPASTLRYYERAGLVSKAVRIGGARQYGARQLREIQFVHTAQQAGFSLEEIRRMMWGFPRGVSYSRRWEAMAKRKLPELAERIRKVERMRELLLGILACKPCRLKEGWEGIR